MANAIELQAKMETIEEIGDKIKKYTEGKASDDFNTFLNNTLDEMYEGYEKRLEALRNR